VNPTDLDGRLIALLVIGQTEGGEDDGAAFTGILRFEAEQPYLDRGPGKQRVELEPEWLERIKPVDAAIRQILIGADYYIPLSIGPVPEGEDESKFRSIGLKWPEP